MVGGAGRGRDGRREPVREGRPRWLEGSFWGQTAVVFVLYSQGGGEWENGGTLRVFILKTLKTNMHKSTKNA